MRCADANLDLDLDIAAAPSPSYTTADVFEHGAGSMLVASPGELQHHVSPNHDTRDAFLMSPPPVAAAPEPAPSMEVAPADASAQDAPAVPRPDAPAAQDTPDLSNGLPALGDPIAFSQPPDLNGVAMDVGMGMDAGTVPPDFTTMDSMDWTQPPAVMSDERLSAFARLRFDDGSYYMHTYQIMLGRNIELAHRDMRRLAKVDQLRTEGHPQAAENLLNGKMSKKNKRRAARSVISERGGIVSAPIASMPLEYQRRRQSNASHSLSSGSHPTGESGEEKPAERAPQDMIMQAFPEVPPQFDGHVPEDPNDCPLVPIHPQHITASTGTHGPKGISREHAKIFFDSDMGDFCIQVLGSNGLYHNEEYRYRGDIARLEHGDHLAIGAVEFSFFLPDVALTEEQRRQESGSRPMSFSFENGHGELETDEQMSSDSEGELSINPRHMYHYPLESDIESDDAAGDDDLDDYEEPVPRPRQKQSKLKIKLSARPPPSKEVKNKHKRKEREITPEEMPRKKHKKSKHKHKESHRDSYRESHKEKEREPKPAKEPKASKESKVAAPKEPKEVVVPKEVKEPKEKGKAPAKTSSKTPVKEEEPIEPMLKETPVKEKPDPPKAVPNDSPPLLRKSLEGELEAGGEIEGLITEEMARHHNLPASLIGQVVEKRKGPGRPPKDGIMSKRQRSQLIKQAKEIERAKAAGIDPADIPMPSMKPKIAKRKDSNALEGEDGDVLESTENGDGMSGDRKLMKPSKPPRTPSPEPRIEDYSEEQLQRPTANYVVLIHEAISSSPSGQMNLQQIYNYIERKYPWYKFKTTTSGWQSSVRHNLGQHDAFVKGDKEGKGFNWKINQEVSIEKERRKRQVSPPVNHAQRQPYYPPPSGYPPYQPPGYPPYPGMAPHHMPNAAPRLPPSLQNPAPPRLPPSMAREGSTSTPVAPQSAPRPSPYASPWATGTAARSPPAPNPPQPYPQANPQTPPVSAAGTGNSQYGVLLPTSASQSYSGPPAMASPYGGPYSNSNAAPSASPYGPPSGQPYPSYPQPGQQPTGRPTYPPQPQPHPQYASSNDPPGRYLAMTPPDLIRQLEAFRTVYLKARTEPGEDIKVDNAIRAYVDPRFPKARLNAAEVSLFDAISGIEDIKKYNKTEAVQQPPPPVQAPVETTAVSSDTAVAIAADAAANTVTTSTSVQHTHPPTATTPNTATPPPPTELQIFTPNVMASDPGAPPTTTLPPHVSSLPPSHRPSVEPLTPVHGSPVIANGTLPKRSFAEVSSGTSTSAEPAQKVDHDEPIAGTASKEESSATEQTEEKPTKVEEAPPATK